MARRIAILTGEMGGGGAERVSALLSDYLSAQGHQIHLICFLSGDIEYPVRKGIRLHYLDKSGNRFLNLAARAFSLNRILTSIQPEILISLGFGYHYLGFCHAYSRYKVILSERNDPYSQYKSVFSKWMIRHDYERAHAVVFQTKGAMSFFPDSIRRKSTIIPNPVKADLPDLFTGNRRKCIVAVCRLEPQKNIPLLLRAFAGFRRTHAGYVLEIFGRGAQEAALKKMSVDLGIATDVFFRGFRKEVHQEIHDAAMYVSSSDYEGISNATIEALAMGLPSICTDCPPGGARLLIENGKNGLLVPVGNEAELTGAMARIADDQALSGFLSSNAFKIRQELSIHAIGHLWDGCMQKLMG